MRLAWQIARDTWKAGGASESFGTLLANYIRQGGYVVNFPDRFHNVAWKCVGANGIYTHTREAPPIVIAGDPNCAPGGLWEQLKLAHNPDQAVHPVAGDGSSG